MKLSMPLRFDHRGRTAESTDARYVRELIEAVLFTAPGERVMRPDFGAGLAQLVFEPGALELAGTTEMLVQSALTQWLSDHVAVSVVRVEVEEAVLRVTVSYVLRGEDGEQTHTFEFGGTP